MPSAHILGVGTAVPKHCYKQMDICEGLADAFNNRRAPAVFRATEIETRYSVLEDYDWLLANPDNQTRHQRYIAEAPALGIKAIRRALEQASLSLQDIDEFIAVSCTGVDTPGLDILIADELGMSPYLRRSAVVGMGCHALMPALHQAATIVTARPQSKVLILTLEICTIHVQHSRSIKNILGSALFADGASAAVVGSKEKGLRLLDSLSYSDYQTQTEMSFHPGNTGYKIYLSTRIPALLRQQVPPLIDRLLSPHGLNAADIAHWVVHPGGMKIVDYIEEVMGLNAAKLQPARDILRKYGNMSSATLLFVLERVIQQSRPLPGDYGLLIGFGPGVTIEVGLVQW